MLLRKELGSYFCIRLRHEVFVDKTSAVTSVAWNVLLAHLVGGAVNPILGVPAVISKNLRVDFFRGWQRGGLLSVTLELHAVDLLSSAASNANFAINASSSLTKEVVLSGHVTSVPRQVLSGPSARLLLGEVASIFRLECLVRHL